MWKIKENRKVLNCFHIKDLKLKIKRVNFKKKTTFCGNFSTLKILTKNNSHIEIENKEVLINKKEHSKIVVCIIFRWWCD